MKHYQQLSYEERVCLSAFRKRGDLVARIAQLLNRHRSTLYRELKRNQHPNGYYSPFHASRYSSHRRQRPSPKQSHPYLRKYLIRALRKGWSPEIIAGRMKLRGLSYRACTETLYKLIYSDHGKRYQWYKYLAWARPRRTTWNAGNRSQYLNFTPLSKRSPLANERKEFGHWEGDSVHFTNSKNQHIAIAIRQNSSHSKPVMTSIKHKLYQQPRHARKSIALDQGTEFSHFQIIERPIKGCRQTVKTYYCKPKAPWH